jgi:hypothetical protein
MLLFDVYRKVYNYVITLLLDFTRHLRVYSSFLYHKFWLRISEIAMHNFVTEKFFTFDLLFSAILPCKKMELCCHNRKEYLEQTV